MTEKTIERFSTVILTEDLPEEGLVAGDSGTAIDIYDEGAAYEVEFFTLSGDIIEVATVESNMIRPATRGNVTHSRDVSR